MSDPEVLVGSETEPSSPRLRKNALARLISDGALIVTGLVSATITARVLGPSGKGTLSTMIYIVSVSSLVASLGLGDAVIVLAGGNKKKLQDLISISWPLLLVSSVPATAGILLAARIGNWSQIAVAVGLACLLVPARALHVTLINFQNAEERLVRSSLISAGQVFVEVAFLVVLVVALGLDIAGAIGAALVGTCAAIVWSIRALRQDGVLLKPRLDLAAARPIYTLGGSLIAAQIVIALSHRFDLLLVYTINGETPAGLYAVALTLGHLSSYTSRALAIAAFPRLARIDDSSGWQLIPKLARMGLTSAVLSAVVLVIVFPFVIPLLFGDAFRGAVAPTLVLTASAIAWSELTILARSVAALGKPLSQLVVFASNLVLMVALDLIFVPRWGPTGAALASLSASFLVLIGFLAWYRQIPQSEPLQTFVPTRVDVRELLAFLRDTSVRAARLLRDPRSAWNA